MLQISDPHFGTEQAPVVRALEELVQAQQPDVLVLSGDITQRARVSQFEAARDFVDRLGVAHWLAIPGNHDIPLFDMAQRLGQPYARFERSFGSHEPGVISLPDVLLVPVNTTRWWRHKNGEISNAQIEAVSLHVRNALPGQLRIVVVHQPVHVLREQDKHDLLRNCDEAIAAWSAAGADVIMGGHIHLPYVCPLHESLKGLPRRLWCVQAGTAVSSRVRREAPNSVNLLRDCGAEWAVEQWDYAGAAGEFHLARTTRILPQR
ncbi:MAG: metallophosphoesterase [Pseudomonadota bacterium]